jgi:diketogulonate reductase-like aldo/keto reductase
MIIPETKLNTGRQIPAIGFGTWQLRPDEAKQAVLDALKTGYRLIDTAKIYRNEASVGQAIKQSHIERQDIFVTTKLWPQDFGYDSGLAAFNESLKKLDTQYLDLYLLHWPDSPRRKDAWRALGEIYKQGKAKSVGVSNYMVEHLQELLAESDLVPAVNQIEFHPFIYHKQKPVLEMCQKHDIAVEAYSPLTVGRRVNDPGISQIATRINKSNAQVILRWCIQRGTIPIPRSTNPAHIQENLAVFDFELSEPDMTALDKLGQASSWQPNEM